MQLVSKEIFQIMKFLILEKDVDRCIVFQVISDILIVLKAIGIPINRLLFSNRSLEDAYSYYINQSPSSKVNHPNQLYPIISSCLSGMSPYREKIFLYIKQYGYTEEDVRLSHLAPFSFIVRTFPNYKKQIKRRNSIYIFLEGFYNSEFKKERERNLEKIASQVEDLLAEFKKFLSNSTC